MGRDTSSDMTNTVEIRSLKHRWDGDKTPVLDMSAFDLGAGEHVFVHGPSGSGKSTFLSAIAGVIKVQHGTIQVVGTDVGAMAGSKCDRFRVDHLGIIFQVFNLLPWLSALENTLLPCRFSARRRQNAGPDPGASAKRLLASLGLSDPAVLNGPANALSVGQQQRVAAARALIGSPDILLADEPTSALDEDTKALFVDLLLRECRASGASLLFVSHDRGLERQFDRSVDLRSLNDGAA